MPRNHLKPLTPEQQRKFDRELYLIFFVMLFGATVMATPFVWSYHNALDHDFENRALYRQAVSACVDAGGIPMPTALSADRNGAAAIKCEMEQE